VRLTLNYVYHSNNSLAQTSAGSALWHH